MRKEWHIVSLLIWLSLFSISSADSLSGAFKDPSEATKPWCYWYWTDGDITADGITKDLEIMAVVGIKRAMIGNVDVRRFETQNGSPAPVKILSPKWRELKMHALREAKRVGVDIYFFNCPGWSQSGGPWIKPEQSMRRVIWNEFESNGGTFKQNVRAKGVPGGGSQDIAVLAVAKIKAVSIEGEPAGKQLVFSHSEPVAARSLSVNGALSGSLFAVQNELDAESDKTVTYKLTMSDGSTRSVKLGDGSATSEKKNPKIVMTKAVYGAPGVPNKQVDVTEKIQALVSAGESTVKASNALAGRDPAYGTPKQLELVYSVNGIAHTVLAKENEAVNLPVIKPERGQALLKIAGGKTESTDNDGFTETRVAEFKLPKKKSAKISA